MNEEFENTKGLIRRRIPKKDRQEDLKDTQGVIMGGTPTEDIHEEFEDTKRVIRAVHRRWGNKKSLKIQKE